MQFYYALKRLRLLKVFKLELCVWLCYIVLSESKISTLTKSHHTKSFNRILSIYSQTRDEKDLHCIFCGNEYNFVQVDDAIAINATYLRVDDDNPIPFSPEECPKVALITRDILSIGRGGAGELVLEGRRDANIGTKIMQGNSTSEKGTISVTKWSNSSARPKDSEFFPITLNKSKVALSPTSSLPQILFKATQFLESNMFLIGLFVTAIISQAFPNAGRDGGTFHPEWWVGRFGVELTFLLSGLSLELYQLTNAAMDLRFNILIQLITFVLWPLVVGLPTSKYGHHVLSLPQEVLDGVFITSCLPTSVNMCIILTGSAGGNTAISIFNAMISNLFGIIITPMLLFRFFGTSIDLPLFDMLMKLSCKVVVPVCIGQVFRLIPTIKNSHARYPRLFKQIQEMTLLCILWNAFCNALVHENISLSFRQTVYLVIFMAVLHIMALGLNLFLFHQLADACDGRINCHKTDDVVAAMFCSSHKTLAFGLPLIQTMFSGSQNIALYSAPIMCLHPLQLIIGSILLPKFQKYTKVIG